MLSRLSTLAQRLCGTTEGKERWERKQSAHTTEKGKKDLYSSDSMADLYGSLDGRWSDISTEV